MALDGSLVLSRNDNECIEFEIDGEIVATIMVKDCVRGKCRVVIKADKHIRITRPDAVNKHPK